MQGAYEEYLHSRRELDLCRKEIRRLTEQQKLSMEKLEKLQNHQRSLEAERDALLREEEEQQDAVRKYRRYEEYTELAEKEAGEDWRKLWEDAGDWALQGGGQEEAGRLLDGESRELAGCPQHGGLQKPSGQPLHGMSQESSGRGRLELRKVVADMEARYAAVTATVSLEIQELERQEQLSGRRYKESDQELRHLQKKFGLSETAWKDIHYNRKEESHQEVLLEDRQLKIQTKQALWNEEDKRIAVITQQKSDLLKRMRTECGREEPLPKAQIQTSSPGKTS